MTTDNGAATDSRSRYGLIALLAGLAAMLIAFVVIMRKFDTAADVGAVLGAFAASTGTMVAAYFGVAVGSSGKSEADTAAAKANQALVRLAASSDPGEADVIINRVYGD